MEPMMDEDAPVRDLRAWAGYFFLALFWLFGSIAGFFFGAGYGCAGMAVSSLIVAWFLGSE